MSAAKKKKASALPSKKAGKKTSASPTKAGAGSYGTRSSRTTKASKRPTSRKTPSSKKRAKKPTTPTKKRAASRAKRTTLESRKPVRRASAVRSSKKTKPTRSKPKKPTKPAKPTRSKPKTKTKPKKPKKPKTSARGLLARIEKLERDLAAAKKREDAAKKRESDARKREREAAQRAIAEREKLQRIREAARTKREEQFDSAGERLVPKASVRHRETPPSEKLTRLVKELRADAIKEKAILKPKARGELVSGKPGFNATWTTRHETTKLLRDYASKRIGRRGLLTPTSEAQILYEIEQVALAAFRQAQARGTPFKIGAQIRTLAVGGTTGSDGVELRGKRTGKYIEREGRRLIRAWSDTGSVSTWEHFRNSLEDTLSALRGGKAIAVHVEDVVVRILEESGDDE